MGDKTKPMNPKEKAKDIYNKMAIACYQKPFNQMEDCRECSIIVVDEILEFIDNATGGFLDADWVAYWQLVKEHIQKL